MRRLSLVFAAAAVTACSSTPIDDEPADAGVPATTMDATTVDAGDAVRPDAGVRDGGVVDAGPTDAGATDAGSSDAGSIDGGNRSIAFVVNATNQHDFGRMVDLPAAFGVGEFTLDFWMLPDDSLPLGPCRDDAPGQLTEWCEQDEEPSSDGDWWYKGNFLLDGHNNRSCFCDGTFSFQWYGGGRLRWLFGDNGDSGSGGVWSVGAYPATTTPSLLDGQWHHVAVVRRWVGTDEADLELWLDGTMADVTRSDVRTNMRDWWDNWDGFGADEAGWYWGAEKQAANRSISQYEDYKGLFAELRFWSRARTTAELTTAYAEAASGSEPGLEALYRFDGTSTTESCDSNGAHCITWTRMSSTFRRTDSPPFTP